MLNLANHSSTLYLFSGEVRVHCLGLDSVWKHRSAYWICPDFWDVWLLTKTGSRSQIDAYGRTSTLLNNNPCGRFLVSWLSCLKENSRNQYVFALSTERSHMHIHEYFHIVFVIAVVFNSVSVCMNVIQYSWVVLVVLQTVEVHCQMLLAWLFWLLLLQRIPIWHHYGGQTKENGNQKMQALLYIM